MSFSAFCLSSPKPILEALTLEMRFDKPSAIQATTIPLILSGANVIAQAQAGAGKTIAFTIGMLSRIDTSRDTVQALCLTPTRELAQQIISDAVVRLSTRIPNIRCEPALPGYDVERGRRCTSHVVVGTPGTVKKWLSFRYLDLATVKVFVLDEADAMVAKSQQAKSLGADTLAIKKMLSPQCQILFFSATYTKEIIDFSGRIVNRAHLVTLKSDEDLILDVVFQVCMNVNLVSNRGGKLQVLQDIYDFMAIKQSIVFVEMRREADRVAAMMREKGFEVSVLHGELQGIDRDMVMNDFRQGVSKVLITTNALARGVDVPSVAVVVNYDLPTERLGQTRVVGDTATYVHRIGRCSRFGRKGMVINFLETQQDAEIMSEIEMYYSPKHRMTTDWDPNDIEGLKDAIDNRKTASAASNPN
jgi:ATP-dependent RNA helicase DDX19/DBP5